MPTNRPRIPANLQHWSTVRPDDIHPVVRILKGEVGKWPLPTLANFLETPFTVLISCVLSLRTQDKTTYAASARLFDIAATPETMLATPVKVVEKTIYPVSFYRTKAKSIHKICRILLDSFGGEVPSEIDQLLTLPGVGRKTANIVVTLAFRKPGIAVDTHVHRISNRLGYVRTKDADKTEMALRKKLPPKYWIVFNDLLVAYGQNLCKPISPHCSICKIEAYCRKVGVKKSR
jgi:endonuclease-3